MDVLDWLEKRYCCLSLLYFPSACFWQFFVWVLSLSMCVLICWLLKNKKGNFLLRFYVNHENDTSAWEKYPSGTFDNTIFQSSISNKILLTNAVRYWCNQLVILLEGMEKNIFPSYSTVVTFFSYLNSLFWKSIGIILFWHVLRKHCVSGTGWYCNQYWQRWNCKVNLRH